MMMPTAADVLMPPVVPGGATPVDQENWLDHIGKIDIGPYRDNLWNVSRTCVSSKAAGAL
jgi:hypothetical protein